MRLRRSSRLPYSVSEVLSVKDGEVRNHVITYSYERVGETLATHLGRNDVNWCSFAAWASRTVGHVLNEDELPGRLATGLRRVPAPIKLPALSVISVIRQATFRRHRIALISGNTAVFQDVATHFMDLVAFIEPGATDVGFEDWLQTFSAPPNRPEMQRELELLRDGFRLYRRASQLPLDDRRSELLYVAAVHVAAYEQLLLQPAIESALFTSSTRSRIPFAPHALAARLLTQLMVVHVPGGVVRISGPLTAWPKVSTSEPIVDRQAPMTPEAQRIFDRFPPLTQQEVVTNWADYDQRMRWIVEFFRRFHADGSFTDGPFAELEINNLSAVCIHAYELFGVK
jgi:hypothetical protein